MENVYDIRRKENLYFILPENTELIENENTSLESKAAVFVNLFYYDDISCYTPYLKRIPEEIALYVFSPDDRLLQALKSLFGNRKHFKAIKKKNRGRDISALLIAAGEYFFLYDYVCFIHDKTWKREEEIDDIKAWRDNLWENTLCSAAYIRNVLNLLNRNNDLGLLVPPEPFSETVGAWYSSAWYGCFEETQKVAERLSLKADISIEKPPISLSTVFWCRTDALKKLIAYPWTYEDFPDEPLPRIAVNHGVERVLAFVAQDAGYKTGTVMTEAFSKSLIVFSQYHFQRTFSFLYELAGVTNLSQLYGIIERKEKFIQFFHTHENVFLFGAGIVGKRALKIVRFWNCIPKGFVVSEVPAEKQCEGLPVYQIDELNKLPSIGILVTVGWQYQQEIQELLKTKGFGHYLLFDC